jgi:hypothetical protein
LIQPAFDAAVQSYNAILLRLNPSERNKRLRALNGQFLASLGKTRDALRRDDFEAARNHADTLHEKLRPILKREWIRVKKGERIYRTTLWIAASVLLAGLILAGASFFKWKHTAMDRKWISTLPIEVAFDGNGCDALEVAT